MARLKNIYGIPGLILCVSIFTIHWYIQAVFFFLLPDDDVFTSMSVPGTLLYSCVTFAWVIIPTVRRHVDGESLNLSVDRLRCVNLCSVT